MHKIGYYIIIFFLKAFSLLPLKVHYALAGAIAFILDKVLHYRRSVIVSNISRSFPELTYWEINKLTKEFYKHLADVVVESVWCYSASTEEIGKQVKITGQEDLEKALSHNKNAIIMLGHLGNWEIFTGLPDLRTHYGLNLDNKDFVYAFKRQQSKIAELLIENIRNRHKACSTIEIRNIVRYIATHREGRKVFFLICDQNPPGCQSRFVAEFLHQKTYMIDGPELIASKLGMPVLYCGLVRNGRGNNSANFKLITEDASKCTSGEVTAKFAEMLEKDIDAHRATWLWSHKKWKKRIV